MCRILLICLHEYKNSVVERFELPWSCQIAHFIFVWINLETTAKEKDRKIIEVDKEYLISLSMVTLIEDI